MVRFQNSISEHLHHHTLFSMLFDRIFEAHCAQILSCFGPRAGVWLTIWPIFLGFWLTSLVFSTMFWIWFKLPHSSIVGIFWCVYTHPIDLINIHLLRCVHGNEHTWMNPWCTSQHLCYHCVRWWLPHGVKTTTCIFFKHVQLLQLRQGLARLRAKRGSPGVKESVREWTLTLLRELPPWELESRWTLECSKSNYRGKNLMDWRVLYTIEKLLKRRCLKRARVTHLDIWNTSYGQKKVRESNWQFDS